jgi:pimeloyl-ACP methyl ester carboxylesterase
MTRRRTALIGAGVAAGVAATALAERRLASRLMHAPDPEAREPLGSLHVPGRPVLADDGVPLHVEEVGDPSSRPTVVFIHGFTLSMDAWHYQRRDLADVGHLVFFDLRSHGASGRGPREHATVEQLGQDLYAVLRATAPDGPVVLVGHSLGGMTIMALAEQHPELFGSRIVGAAFLSTAASQVMETLFGLPPAAGRLLKFAAPTLIPRLTRRSALLERGRTLSTDVSFLVTRYFAFGRNVPPSLIAFNERMIAATPMDVIFEFMPTLLDHDRLAALEPLRDIEVLVLTGARDTLVNPSNSEKIAAAIDGAELVSLADAGHMVIIERPALVNLHLRAFIGRAVRGRGRRAVSA